MADKKVRQWVMELPEPYRTRIITYSIQQFGNSRLDDWKAASRGGAVNFAMAWDETPEGNDYWRLIYNELINDPEYLHKRVLTEGHTTEALASTIEASASITVTTKENQSMKNGTYAVAKLITKTEKELAANKAAVAKFNADVASRKTVIDTIKAQFKLSPSVPAPEGCTADVTSVTLKFTGPVVVDNTAKLGGILTKLNNLSGTEIGWNEDIEYVLGDFSKVNGSETKTVDVTVTPEK